MQIIEEHDGGRIKVVRGDIWETSMQVIVVPVNAMGVMGAGMAKEAARRYPEECSEFTKRCKEFRQIREEIAPAWRYMPKLDFRRAEHNTIGKWMSSILNGDSDSRLCMLTTKKHWKNTSTVALVRYGLAYMAREYLVGRQHLSVAFPALGCGLGGLAWSDVKPLILGYALLSSHPAVEVYEPQ